MSSSSDFTQMSDPEFLAERQRVREELEKISEQYQRMDAEFDRRAAGQWATAS